MKKLITFILGVIVTLFMGYSATYAESYFSNNKALDSIFTKLEKEFLQYKVDEVIPLRDMGEIITDENQPRLKRTSKKISASQVKAAAQKELNDIRTGIEIMEEELGGLTQEDYKSIEDHIIHEMFFAKNSDFGWDFDGKTVQLYFSLSQVDKWLSFKDVTGNFGKMDKEKDQVNPAYSANLQVKDKVIRYLKQSMQQGKKVSPEILEKLPGEVEKLFTENNLSPIVAARLLARIHVDIYGDDTGNTYENYDGSESVEEITEKYSGLMSVIEEVRETEKKLEYYEYPEDKPSDKFREYITELMVNGELSEPFTHGFNKAITIDELARLKFGSRELEENIVIDDDHIPADSPDYIKQAYIFGMIDNTENLNKSLTRLEAARILGNSAIYGNWFDCLTVTDCNQIPVDDLLTVGSCLKAGMKTRYGKFEPQSSYTKEEAIIDYGLVNSGYLRNYVLPISLKEPSKIIIGKNTINLLFQNNDEIEQFIKDNFEDTVLEKIKVTGKYMRIDAGGALIELFTPEKGIKFTIKNGTKYFNLEEGDYGPRLGYKIEPKVLKDNEKVNMNMQEDSITKKLNTKLDAILAKIIKPGMTQEQKVKAIHDYVVLHVTYDSRYREDQSIGSVLAAIDEGRGVCGDYSLLFRNLCLRASIPCTFEASYPLVLNHAWNAVFINGEWKFVDTTWDDRDNGKVLYTYFLKDRLTFMSNHTPFMGVPNEDYYTYKIDPMKIKDQDELRAYLLKNFYRIDGFKLTFRMSDKSIKPFIGYLWTTAEIKRIQLDYDSKNNLYTVTAKAKK
ncbi:MAG: hypothetical protein K0R50_1750 [Eubacterium sp.]|nr:hypothetical protein [Eubacterium sp.]